jgi:hypothetical protein
MGQQLAGSALALIGLALYGFVAVDMMGLYNTGEEPIFLVYGFLIAFLGGGVYTGEIYFEQESAWKYEGLIFIFAILIVIMIVGVIFISIA